MIRFPYARLGTLFAIFQTETAQQERLAARLGLSSRTIRSDVANLNDFLLDFGAQVILRRGLGYQLNITDETLYAAKLNQPEQGARIPRQSRARVQYLLVKFLTSRRAIKLQTIADEWFVSRAALQRDMVGVRAYLQAYELSIMAKPHYGMTLMGKELMKRSCLSDLLVCLALESKDHPLLYEDSTFSVALAYFEQAMPACFENSAVRLTVEGAQFLVFYCAVALSRSQEASACVLIHQNTVDHEVRQLALSMTRVMQAVANVPISESELTLLCLNIEGRRLPTNLLTSNGEEGTEGLTVYLLDYLNRHYQYDLRCDNKLCTDLNAHIKTMMTRIKHQIKFSNPMLDDIKTHYAMAYDMTLSAISSWENETAHQISDNEIGYLVLHIGVALERHYQITFVCHPEALFVCDSGMSTVRLLEANLAKKYPNLQIKQTLSLREYERLDEVRADFVISTMNIATKNKPVQVLATFPTETQWAQLTKLVEMDRTRPYLLARFFDERCFRVIDGACTQAELFEQVCSQLQAMDYVGADFLPSLLEREQILSTVLGGGIALPHSLGLLAKKTVVYTVIAPQGILWAGNHTAHVIFVLAISKTDYESAMALYDLFIALIRQKLPARLMSSTDFMTFKTSICEPA